MIIFSLEHRRAILARNRKTAAQNRPLLTKLATRGLKCLGGLPIRRTGRSDAIQKRCPYDMTLDLDTSLLVPWNGSSTEQKGLTLDFRCHFCLMEYNLRDRLRRINAFRDGCEDGDICECVSCVLPSEHLAKYCSKHIIDAGITNRWASDYSSPILREKVKQALRKGISPPNSPWSSAGVDAFENFVQKYRSSDQVSATVLDLEFGNSKTYMAAAYDFLTGDEIFETWLDNERTGTADMTVPGNHLVAHPHHDANETARESGILGKVFMRFFVEAKGEERVNALNAKQLVAELEKATISPRTFVFTYATHGGVDLGRLNKWIDKRLPKGTKNPSHQNLCAFR